MKLFKYLEFMKENIEYKKYFIPSYEEALEMCDIEDVFYESKNIVDGYKISSFNYRFAQHKDFVTPIIEKPELSAYEMRGLTYVFNKDGTVFNRYILLEKFFNLNQVPESMYSVVKDYKIKFINNKEDGSIASFIKLPNNKVVGKSKMGFDNDQSNGINRIYKTNADVKKFVDWSLSKNYTAIFEYVSPNNRIVLRYSIDELILLRLRDNNTGKHIDIRDHLDKIGSIRIAPFEDENSLDELIKMSENEIGREGWVITFENGQMIKIKTSEYQALHGLLTEDTHKEHIIISYILDDNIDDILGQIPEDEVESHERINKIISIVKRAISNKVLDIRRAHQVFVNMGGNRKEYALKYRQSDPNFSYVMSMEKGEDIYDLAKEYISDKTKRLMIARDWLSKIDPTLFFSR